MPTPFDCVIDHISGAGYHNHRTEAHSDLLAEQVWTDLLAKCPALREDHEKGVVRKWLNIKAPGGRHRRIDLFVGDPDEQGRPDVAQVRIGVENKSVITAHRNKTNRFDDLSELTSSIHNKKPEAVIAATVIIGTAEQVLNVPDRVRPVAREFEKKVLPRLSTGDETLWKEFPFAISKNRPNDPEKTIEKFQTLAIRSLGHTHKVGLDWLLLIPMHIDNVNPPRLEPPGTLGIDSVRECQNTIRHLC
jgi:hypothetical protein